MRTLDEFLNGMEAYHELRVHIIRVAKIIAEERYNLEHPSITIESWSSVRKRHGGEGSPFIKAVGVEGHDRGEASFHFPIKYIFLTYQEIVS